MNGSFPRFKAYAVEMEQDAIDALRRTLSPEQRDLANGLLRHARGILTLIEKFDTLDA